MNRIRESPGGIQQCIFGRQSGNLVQWSEIYSKLSKLFQTVMKSTVQATRI